MAHDGTPAGTVSHLVRPVIGWLAVTCSILFGCTWAFWGAIETGTPIDDDTAYDDKVWPRRKTVRWAIRDSGPSDW